MKHRIHRVLWCACAAPVLLQAGCLTASDVQFIAQGQLISFVNALINTVTSDWLRAALGS